MVDRSVPDIFDEWSARRSAILRALTTDVDEFFALCVPHREGLCLFGNRDGTWHVGPPSFEVPPIIPEPCNGINCARDSLDKLSWLALVCVHAESWLLSVALFRAFCLTHKQREELFLLIHKETPLLEIVTSSQDINNRLGEASYEEPASQDTQLTIPEEDDYWEDGDGDPCPLCAQHYKCAQLEMGFPEGCLRQGNFWICCDFCEKWFCGKCVQLNEASAARFTKWKCPICHASRANSQPSL